MPTKPKTPKAPKATEAAAPCPSCGHCPTCGRAGYHTSPYPWWRYTEPHPWWNYPVYSRPNEPYTYTTRGAIQPGAWTTSIDLTNSNTSTNFSLKDLS